MPPGEQSDSLSERGEREREREGRGLLC